MEARLKYKLSIKVRFLWFDKDSIKNATQKEEISKLNNNNVKTEWRDIVIGKKKAISESQMNLLNAVRSEQNERK